MKSSRETIFITGISGFVGPMILKGLLLKNYNIIALLRKSDLSREELLEKIFEKTGISSSYLNKITLINGDISKKNLGIEESTINSLDEKITEIWHLAASLSFRSRDREKNFSTNLDGTKNVFSFANNIKAKRFFYMSTAYIRGSSAGTIYERPIKKPKKFNNSYEETKWEAENYIINHPDRKNLTSVIFRPSIIVGNEEYMPENNFGYYNFLASIYALKNSLISSPKILKATMRIFGIGIEQDKIHIKIPFPCVRAKSLNLMPIDKLTYLASKISEHHRLQQRTGVFIYNLADPNPITLTILFYKTFRGLGLHVQIIHLPLFLLKLVFRFTIIGAIFFPQIKRFSRSLFYYQQYIFNEAQYDIENIKKIVGSEIGNESFLTSQKLQKIIKGFLLKHNPRT